MDYSNKIIKKPLVDFDEYAKVAEWCNENGKAIVDEGDRYVVSEDEFSRSAAELGKIAELKAKLAATDYVVIKIAEGCATQYDYSEVLAERKAWREELQALGQ